MNRKEHLFFLLFLSLWLIPSGYVGLTRDKPPLLPGSLRFVQDNAFLFPAGARRLCAYYAQVRVEGSDEWHTIPLDSEYFKMPSFGYRKRFYRFFELFSDDVHLVRAGDELSSWVGERYVALNPASPKPVAVRFLRGFRAVDDPTAFRGRWVRARLEDLPPTSVQVMSTHVLSK